MSIHKYKLKDGIGWRAIVQVSPTKQVSKCFGRKLDAEEWEREQRQKAAGGAACSLNLRLTVRELSQRWMTCAAAERREKSSNYRYEVCIRRQILPSLGGRRVVDLSHGEVDSWLQSLKGSQRLSTKTANLCLMILKKMLSDAVRWQLIRYSPIAAVKPLPEAERDFSFWNHDEVVKFLEFARSAEPSQYPVFATALYTGMRLGEIQALKWDCVDLENRLITVKRTYCLKDFVVKEKTKTKRVRRVPINGPLFEVLVSIRNRGPEMVFADFSYQHASRRIRELARAAGVREIRFHDLRHTFASLFVMSGGPIYKLQRLLGHATIQMTERYSHLSPDHLADATDVLNFELSKPADVLSFARS